MRREAERPRARQRAVLQFAGEALYHRNFEGLAGVERRQQPRQPARQHGFARARRADHQHVVAASRRNLQRTLCRFTDLHILGTVGYRNGSGGKPCGGRAQHLRAFDVVDEATGERRGDDVEFARPGGFGTIGGSADELAARARRGNRSREHARHRGDMAIEREFAERQS